MPERRLATESTLIHLLKNSLAVGEMSQLVSAIQPTFVQSMKTLNTPGEILQEKIGNYEGLRTLLEEKTTCGNTIN